MMWSPSTHRTAVPLCRAGLLLFLVSFVGCTASRPVVYPNDKSREVGPQVVAADIDECTRRAHEFASGNARAGQVAKDTAGRTVVSAGVGAAAGAAGGAIYGDAARGAAAGAAGGAAAGLLGGLFDGMRQREPDPVIKNFVTRCLSEKGYEVIGWR
jgi:hypothetical protein